MVGPEYRIKISIYDDVSGEEVEFLDEPKFEAEEEAHVQMNRVLDRFAKDKADFEEVYYPKEL